MKGGGELHPLVGFMAAIGGLQLFGFYGIFVGPLLAGLCFYLIELRWKEAHDN
jgi:predicted PurR-regulated permease PerM